MIESKYTPYRPGIVTRDSDGQLSIRETSSFRLPLYDGSAVDKVEENSEYQSELASKKKFRPKKLANAQTINKKIASLSAFNRKWLNDLRKNDPRQFKAVINGKKSICFTEVKTNSPHDVLAKISSPGAPKAKEGYLKLTGPNNANVSNDAPNHPPTVTTSIFLEHWNDPLKFDLGDGWAWQVSNIKEYPRPLLHTVKDDCHYSITKRCERIFLKPSNKFPSEASILINKRHLRRYSELVKESQQFTEHLAKQFRSRIPENLEAGDLVYFRTDKAQTNLLDSVIPVALFRLQDDGRWLALAQ